MASTQANITAATASPDPGNLMVSLAPLPGEALETAIANLALAFPGQNILVATPNTAAPQLSSGSPLRLLPYTATAPTANPWVLTPDDYRNTFLLADQNNATTCLLLGAEAQTLHPEAIRSLATAARTADLTVAHYQLGPHEGLVNSAILYPVTRALFCAQPRFPLANDLGFSLRMAERLAAAADRFVAIGQTDAVIWPVSEAAASLFTIAEADAGVRTFASPDSIDFNTLFSQIAGSLFADIDAKAAFWQRGRALPPLRSFPHRPAPADSRTDVAPMLEAFHLAYSNLHEIWALVLPPNALLGLKKLSLMSPETFRMPDSLWARIVYDFILAYRLRTINRGHLLGALTPLYLAWVASHLTLVAQGTIPERHIEDLASTFESDKPYFVSRWRWPDRFNP
jgi:glucosylglycerate synthase